MKAAGANMPGCLHCFYRLLPSGYRLPATSHRRELLRQYFLPTASELVGALRLGVVVGLAVAAVGVDDEGVVEAARAAVVEADASAVGRPEDVAAAARLAADEREARAVGLDDVESAVERAEGEAASVGRPCHGPERADRAAHKVLVRAVCVRDVDA